MADPNSPNAPTFEELWDMEPKALAQHVNDVALGYVTAGNMADAVTLIAVVIGRLIAG